MWRANEKCLHGSVPASSNAATPRISRATTRTLSRWSSTSTAGIPASTVTSQDTVPVVARGELIEDVRRDALGFGALFMHVLVKRGRLDAIDPSSTATAMNASYFNPINHCYIMTEHKYSIRIRRPANILGIDEVTGHPLCDYSTTSPDPPSRQSLGRPVSAAEVSLVRAGHRACNLESQNWSLEIYA
ncbi:hypothetical protein BV22DRAFT_1048746 [Leucogyrophana mollusca]|uniref:Uncharacterized protein n=1 Tax=Leucogyrophana mollusca TaxID=85980 RepID=A0ACB8BAN4_9AGAM|nr:hypothetical protein BV22DRAFT_1048746 [Leucogyrophana mollusca]